MTLFELLRLFWTKTALLLILKLLKSLLRHRAAFLLLLTTVTILKIVTLRSENRPNLALEPLLFSSNNRTKLALLHIARALERNLSTRNVRWIKVEHAADSLVPMQFLSIGVYDYTVRKAKFYMSGFAETEKRQLYCRLYVFDASNDRIMVITCRAYTLITDSDTIFGHEIAGGVAFCNMSQSAATSFESITRVQYQSQSKQSSARLYRAIGLLTYDHRVPDKAELTEQLLRYSQTHPDAAAVSLLLFEPPSQASNRTTRSSSNSSSSSTSVSSPVSNTLSDSSTADPSVVTCVKLINSDVDPVRLIEWIEYARLFKTARLVFYTYLHGERRLSDDAYKVLRFYQHAYKHSDADVDADTDFLQLWTADYLIVNTSYATKKDSPLGWTITLLLHAASINLCLDFNRHQFDYVAVYDVDEIWVPLLDHSYPSLLRRLETQHGRRPFTFTNWPYFTELPHVSNDSSVPISQRYFYRANMSHISWKTVSPTQQCMVAHCHFCTSTYPDSKISASNSGRFRVPEDVGALHHHTYCLNHRPNDECQKVLNASYNYVVRDDSLLRYGDQIKKAVRDALAALSHDLA